MRRGRDFRSRRDRSLLPLGRRLPGIPRFSNAPQRRTGEGARCPRTAQTPESSSAALFIPRLAHHLSHTMNQLKLSLRAGGRPAHDHGRKWRTGLCLHILAPQRNKGREETVPITVKASHELAQTLVNKLRKGVAFVVQGQLTTTRAPKRTGKPIRSRRKISPTSPRQSPPRKPTELMSKSTTVTVSLDEDAYGVFQSASEIVSKAGIRAPIGQLVETMIKARPSCPGFRLARSHSGSSNPS
jgi:hypothetical protein